MYFRHIADSIAMRLIMFGLGIILLGSAIRYVILGDVLQQDLEAAARARQQALTEYLASDLGKRAQDYRARLREIAAARPANTQSRAETEAWLARQLAATPWSTGLSLEDGAGKLLARAETDAAGPSNPQPPVLRIDVEGQPPHAGAVLSARLAPVQPELSAVLAQGVLGPHGRLRLLAGAPAAAPRTREGASAPAWIRAAQAEDSPETQRPGEPTARLIVTSAPVPGSGWTLVASQPLDEALAPATHARGYILDHAGIVILIYLALAGTALYMVFRPLMRAAERADRMSRGELPLEPLPVVRDDEVGHLTAAFNRLLEKLQASQAELAHLAHHDALTGLPNRTLLADRMQQAVARARRSGQRMALLFLDLDGFKPVNDRLGHEAGDAALVEVARRLRARIRETDTLARLGGDEFVLLLADLPADTAESAERACLVAAKCIAMLDEPFILAGQSCRLGLSIGIAVGDGTSRPEALLLAADQAMYRVKQEGRGRYALAEG